MDQFSHILERLSTRAKNALVASQKLAETLHHKEIGPEHLFFGILKESTSFASEVVLKHKASAENAKMEIIKLHGEKTEHKGKPVISHALQQILEKAATLAQRYNYQFIGTEHMLYAVIDNFSEAEFLKNLKIEGEEIKKNLQSIFEHFSRLPNFSPNNEEEMQIDEVQEMPYPPKTPSLDYFTVDLTARAAENKVDPLIGRQNEIERLITVLNRRHKNNPVLIGEPGVGKTAIVEGLALAIARGEVPDFLLDKKILYFDLALVVAGSMFRGEFENRIKQIISEVKKNPNIILFLDELHTMIGAGATTGSLDAANILKPSLARGELTVIGASTLADYKKHIESDPALERRFQPILIEEPTIEETKKIVYGLRPYYENHHQVKISDAAVELSCELSARYLTDRFLPDKAIDLIDEASSLIRTSMGSSKELREIRNLEQQISKLEKEKNEAVTKQDFREALKIKLLQQRLTESLNQVQDQLSARPKHPVVEVSGEDIGKIISKITKIPLQKLVKKDIQRLFSLEKVLSKHIIGQDEVLKNISQTIRRARTGIASKDRPMGSFLFLGPTGVGKTETAKVLAREIFGSDNDLLRVDMSEFMERHNVARLIGAPAGYVGYEEGGRLTETVRRKPHQVVLFDEIEKAHPDVYNILLQILEEGELSDAAGKRISFKNTIVILTSNIGTADFNRYAIGFGERAKSEKYEELPDYQKIKEDVLATLRSQMNPELLNRIDHIAVYRPLGSLALRKIVKLELDKLASRLSEQHIQLKFDSALVDFLNHKSFDPKEGARKIRRNIQEEIENLISEHLLNNKIPKKSVLNFRIRKRAKHPIELEVKS